MFLLREVQASHVPKRYILGTVFQRGVGRLTNPLPAKVMANQLRIVQLKVCLEDTGRRSTKERVNGKSTRGKLACLIAASSFMTRCFWTNKNGGHFRQVCHGPFYTNNRLSKSPLPIKTRQEKQLVWGDVGQFSERHFVCTR